MRGSTHNLSGCSQCWGMCVGACIWFLCFKASQNIINVKRAKPQEKTCEISVHARVSAVLCFLHVCAHMHG